MWPVLPQSRPLTAVWPVLFCSRQYLAGGLMQIKMTLVCALLVSSSALTGCSATSFDGISARFERLEADFMSDPEPVDTASIDASDAVQLPELAYRESAPTELSDRSEINGLISQYAIAYDVPAALVHRVVNRESTYKAHARNGIHLGLMQLNPQTARTMGYRGEDAGLLDAETNLKYGIKYLRGAYMVAKGDHDRADKLYQTGYYYHAKRMGLLQATGLRP